MKDDLIVHLWDTYLREYFGKEEILFRRRLMALEQFADAWRRAERGEGPLTNIIDAVKMARIDAGTSSSFDWGGQTPGHYGKAQFYMLDAPGGEAPMKSILRLLSKARIENLETTLEQIAAISHRMPARYGTGPNIRSLSILLWMMHPQRFGYFVRNKRVKTFAEAMGDIERYELIRSAPAPHRVLQAAQNVLGEIRLILQNHEVFAGDSLRAYEMSQPAVQWTIVSAFADAMGKRLSSESGQVVLNHLMMRFGVSFPSARLQSSFFRSPISEPVTPEVSRLLGAAPPNGRGFSDAAGEAPPDFTRSDAGVQAEGGNQSVAAAAAGATEPNSPPVSALEQDSPEEEHSELDAGPPEEGVSSQTSPEEEHSELEEPPADTVWNEAQGGMNLIVFGAPGVGKSTYVRDQLLKGVPQARVRRVVFHPDYTNAEFVGQVLPQLDNGKNLVYEFVPGPLTLSLMDAYADPEHHHYLVIEEINRGRAAAIFGDVFQLLDRDSTGRSWYTITNAEVAKKVQPKDLGPHQVALPANLSLVATMNTADQNVGTLDNAFLRRWSMHLVENSFSNHPEHAGRRIADTAVTWGHFCTVLNEVIIDKNKAIRSTEDKRLGVFFMNKADFVALPSGGHPECRAWHSRLFATKVLRYLWDDVFRLCRSDVFTDSSFEGLMAHYDSSSGAQRWDIFTEDIRLKLQKDEADS